MTPDRIDAPQTDVAEVKARIAELKGRLDRLPRAALAHLPTPLDRCPRLQDALGGPRIWIKRDDCTGLAFGGNKARQLEFVLGEALAQGADSIIQGAASQSNHSRQLAAAAARLGLKAYLLIKADERSTPVQGNLLIDHLMGAEIEMVPPETRMAEAKERLAARLRAEGRRPFVVGMGARRALALAAVAYVQAFVEIAEAMLDGPGLPTHLYVTSQGATQGGLILGARILDAGTRVVGISPMPGTHEAYGSPAEIARIVNQAAEILGEPLRPRPEEIESSCEYVGPAYGVVSRRGSEALRLLARTEGILLDPVYTSKGFSGLIDHVGSGRLTPADRVVFVHTGGLPALFAYAQDVLEER